MLINKADMVNLKSNHWEMKLFCKFSKKQPRLSCVWKCCTLRNSHSNNDLEKGFPINFSHTLDDLHTSDKFSLTFKTNRWQIIFKIDRCLHYFSIFTKKHLCWGLFLITLQTFSSATLLKKHSNTGVFLWILRNF